MSTQQYTHTHTHTPLDTTIYFYRIIHTGETKEEEEERHAFREINYRLNMNHHI